MRRKVAGAHRLHEVRIQRLCWVKSPFRTKGTQGTRFCKVTGQRLIYFKGYSRTVDRSYLRSKVPRGQVLIEDTRQRILKIKGYLRSKDRCSSMAKAPHSHMTKVTLG